MAVKTLPFSDFLRKPKEVAKELDRGDVVLQRRDGPDMRVALADRWEAQTNAIGLLAAGLRHLGSADLERLAGTLVDVLPWVGFLPEKDRSVFVREMVDCLEASASVDNFAPFGELIEAWRNTASLWADPDLAAELLTALPGDGGLVERP
jgi:hypothetical protein